jgi:thiol-disulfide isomerase/thioredoxin
MKITAYHFWSPTCGPCKVIKPSIDDLKEEFTQVTWVSVNTHDDQFGYAEKFGVQVVPTIVVTVSDDNDKLIASERHSGTAMAAYYRILRNALRYN